MRLGKNKKKYWRKCLPEVNDEIVKINQLKAIDDVSFSIGGNSKATELKYSTVPRVIPKKILRFNKTKVIDVWADDEMKPELSKRRKEMIAHMSRYKKPVEIIHPGTSWFPQAKEHEDLLNILANDQMQKNNEKEKYEFKVAETGNDENEEKLDEQEETDDNSDFVKTVRKTKTLTTSEKKKKLLRKKIEKQRQKRKLKEKNEAHSLRNIPKLCKEIKDTERMQKEKLRQNKELVVKQKAEKIVKEQLKAMPFQLPSELAPNLRSMTCEGDIMRELQEKFMGHKFKAEKPKKMKKLRKMFKKKGLN